MTSNEVERDILLTHFTTSLRLWTYTISPCMNIRHSLKLRRSSFLLSSNSRKSAFYTTGGKKHESRQQTSLPTPILTLTNIISKGHPWQDCKKLKEHNEAKRKDSEKTTKKDSEKCTPQGPKNQRLTTLPLKLSSRNICVRILWALSMRNHPKQPSL